MKLKIEKVPEGVRLEVVDDAGREPLVVDLSPVTASMLSVVLTTAVEMEKFEFEFETKRE